MPPGQQPKEGMSTLAKALIGCTVGCFLLILVICGGIFGFAWMLSKPFIEQSRRIESAKTAGNQSLAEIEALDAKTPPRIPEDVATAELTGDDVARFPLKVELTQSTLAVEFSSRANA